MAPHGRNGGWLLARDRSRCDKAGTPCCGNSRACGGRSPRSEPAPDRLRPLSHRALGAERLGFSLAGLRRRWRAPRRPRNPGSTDARARRILVGIPAWHMEMMRSRHFAFLFTQVARCPAAGGRTRRRAASALVWALHRDAAVGAGRILFAHPGWKISVSPIRLLCLPRCAAWVRRRPSPPIDPCVR